MTQIERTQKKFFDLNMMNDKTKKKKFFQS